MKKASELGLFVTESKGVVFLTQKELLTLEETEGVVIDLDGFVAASKQMGTFPLLVIEEEWTKPWEKVNQELDGVNPYAYRLGYLEHQKTHPFTEEDMIEFSVWRTITMFSEPLTPRGQFEKWKSLSEKELWIEVEEIVSHFDVGYAPKIENNQLKAVWK